MNKKLIAAAVAAGLAAPMMAAHAEVNVYGIGQLELVNTSHDTGNSKTTITDSKNSRIGVRWSEDLGDGMKALGEFEWGPAQLDATTTASSNSGFYARQQWIGLSGGWGELQAGQVKAPYKYSGGVTYDPFVATQAQARSGNGGMLATVFGQNGFFSNALAYKKSFGKVLLWLAYSPDENGTGTDGAGEPAQLYSGSSGDLFATLKFSFSQGEVGVAYADNANATGTSGPDGQQNTKVFGKFVFGNNTITAQYEMATNNGNSSGTYLKTGSTTEYADADVWFLGYQLKLPANNLLVAQLGQTSYSDTEANSVDYYALGVKHNFSKNTNVFLAYRNTSQDASAVNVKRDDSIITLGLVEKF